MNTVQKTPTRAVKPVPKRTSNRTKSGPEAGKRVLEVAMAIIEAEGVEGITARRVATAAGISVGSIYNIYGEGHRLKGLDGLVAACKVEILASLHARLGAASEAGAGLGVEKRLILLADTYVDFADTRSKAWMSLFEYGREMDPAAVDRRTTGVFSILEGILSDLPGLKRSRRPLMARAVWSAVHGIVYLGRKGNLGPVRHENVPEMIRALVGALVAGLGEPARGR